jgi:hypothetical protein
MPASLILRYVDRAIRLLMPSVLALNWLVFGHDTDRVWNLAAGIVLLILVTLDVYKLMRREVARDGI